MTRLRLLAALSGVALSLALASSSLSGSRASAETRAPAADCRDLAALAPAGVKIVATDVVESGAGWRTGPGAPAATVKSPFCRIQGVIDKEIGFELWLPVLQSWNGRFLAAGVGGQAGQLNYIEMLRAEGRGYAAASTDAGHKASDPHWLLGDPMRADNYAYANAADDFRRIQGVPVLLANMPLGHTGNYGLPGGGPFAPAGVAWLDWQLKGDLTAKAVFVGARCGLCGDPSWTVQSKNLH